MSNCSRSVDAIGFRILEAINGLSAARPDTPLTGTVRPDSGLDSELISS